MRPQGHLQLRGTGDVCYHQTILIARTPYGNVELTHASDGAGLENCL